MDRDAGEFRDWSRVSVVYGVHVIRCDEVTPADVLLTSLEPAERHVDRGELRDLPVVRTADFDQSTWG